MGKDNVTLRVLKQVEQGDQVTILLGRGKKMPRTGTATEPAFFAGQQVGWVIDLGNGPALATNDNFLSVAKEAAV